MKSSLGISLYPQDANDAKTMLQYADAAMYRAKANGGDCFAFYGHAHSRQKYHPVARGGGR